MKSSSVSKIPKNNETVRLSDFVGRFCQLPVFCLPLVQWLSTRRALCGYMGSLHSCRRKLHQTNDKIMSVTIIFAVGLVVFILFLLGIFFNKKEAEKNIRSKIETDTVDYDGSGNFGRIPNKKPKNRAI